MVSYLEQEDESRMKRLSEDKNKTLGNLLAIFTEMN
jgi:hypothetical protein